MEYGRDSLQDLGNELRETHGNSILAELTLKKLNGDEQYLVFDSIRNPGEIEFLRSHFSILIIGVDANAEDRLNWYLERAKRRGEDNATPESFWAANARDLGEESNSGQQVNRCLELADATIYNRPDAEYLLTKIADEMISLRFGNHPEGLRRRLERFH